MKKRQIFLAILIFGIVICAFYVHMKNSKIVIGKIEGRVISNDSNIVEIKDNDSFVYKFKTIDIPEVEGTKVVVEYKGTLEKTDQVQKAEVTGYEVQEKPIVAPNEYKDGGIFSKYYDAAYKMLTTLTLDQKIGQLFLVRYPNSNQNQEISKYQFGGIILFGKDFKDKTQAQVLDMINGIKQSSNIPPIIAVDEEGGSVVRVSSNKNLYPSKFKSSRELYNLGGLEMIRKDTIEKSTLLKNLGINLNLAPVVDVSTNKNDYMYSRSLGQNADITSEFAKTVIEASKGTGVSYALKHFPGYGNNKDTHTGTSVDSRTYESIMNVDIKPFSAGIASGAEAVLVSHNVVTSVDANTPASLSPAIHNLLRNNLKFTGIIITDDLDMGAVSKISTATLQAVLCGNDIVITTDYIGSINQIKAALANGQITEEFINKTVFRILAWKYYKGLIK